MDLSYQVYATFFWSTSLYTFYIIFLWTKVKVLKFGDHKIQGANQVQKCRFILVNAIAKSILSKIGGYHASIMIVFKKFWIPSTSFCYIIEFFRILSIIVTFIGLTTFRHLYVKTLPLSQKSVPEKCISLIWIHKKKIHWFEVWFVFFIMLDNSSDDWSRLLVYCIILRRWKWKLFLNLLLVLSLIHISEPTRPY